MEDLEKILDDKFSSFKIEIAQIVEKEMKKFLPGDESSKNELMDVFEVSQFLNVTTKTVRKYFADDKLPGIKSVSGRVHFKRVDVEKFVYNIQKKKYGF